MPAELTHGPFTCRYAAAVGVSAKQLNGPEYRRLFHTVHVWRGCVVTPDVLIVAASLVLPPGGALAGRTAAYLHGLDLWGGTVEAVVPRPIALGTRDGLIIRHARLPAADVTVRRGLPVTTPLRTAFDLACLEPHPEGVVCIDAALNQHLITVESLRGYLETRSGWRGVRSAQIALRQSRVGAESPMETRLRLILIEGGLPDPVVNQPVHDSTGQFLARPDLRIDHVLIEFDGEVHRIREVFVRDLRRQNRVVEAGYTILRFTASDLRHPTRVVAQVRAALALRRDRPKLP